MAGKIEVISDMGVFSERMRGYGEVDNPEPLLTQAGGLIAFAEAAFADTQLDKVYAQSNEREAEGRGAHFDVYQSFIDEDRAWIAIFNLAGSAAVRTTVLSTELANAYFTSFPEPTDEAFEARRHFSAIALRTPGVEIKEGRLKAGTGLILPQRVNGPHIIHDIVPDSNGAAGSYIKMAVPNNKKTSRQRMASGNYVPLDQLVTEQLAGNVASNSVAMPQAVVIPKQSPSRTRSRRSCNLD